MNFKNMPELEMRFGYELAIGIMLISTVLTWVWFKKRKWF
jgi:magnesium transporter